VLFQTQFHDGPQMIGGISVMLDNGQPGSYSFVPTVTANGSTPETNSLYNAELKGVVWGEEGTPENSMEPGSGKAITVGTFDLILDPEHNNNPNLDTFHGTYTVDGSTHSLKLAYVTNPPFPALFPGQTRYEPPRGGGPGGGGGGVGPTSPPTTFTWTGNGNGNWDDPKDWIGPDGTEAAPPSNATVNLVFPSNAQNMTTNFDDIPGLAAHSVVVTGDYILSGGNTVVAAAEIGGRSSAQKPEPDPLILPAGSVYAAASSSDVAALEVGPVVLKGTVQFKVRSGELDLNGVVSGPGGITVVGPGVLSLNNSNNYKGNTVLQGGTLQYEKTSSFGEGGTLELQRGTLTAAATTTADKVTLGVDNPVTLTGNVAISGNGKNSSPGGESPAVYVSLGGNVQVKGSAVVTLNTALLLPGAVSLKKGTLLLEDGADGVNVINGDPSVAIQGTVSGSGLIGIYPSGPATAMSAYIRGTLETGTQLEISRYAAARINGSLSGSGAITVAGGELDCTPKSGGNLARYTGTITLDDNGTITTEVALGTGNLVLDEGELSVFHSVDLINRQTTLVGNDDPALSNLALTVAAGATLRFRGKVEVSPPGKATLKGNLSFSEITGPPKLTLSGNGHVTVPPQYAGQLVAGEGVTVN
jgi:autotransporter-associated beta strand protein